MLERHWYYVFAIAIVSCRRAQSHRRNMSLTISKHFRESMSKVRPAYYETIDKLKSCYHMSQSQAEAAAAMVRNKMFGRLWKYHSESIITDLDTLPDAK